MKLTKEQRLWKKGYQGVVGIDEVGRGPFAGPVVAVACMILPSNKRNVQILFKELADSKKLSEQKREYFFKLAKEHTGIKWGVGKSSEKEIDRINILEATKKAMEKAVAKLNDVDYLLIDGNHLIHSKFKQESIIKGDQKIFSCALASVIAKVIRDRIMVRYHKKYPEYGFNKNKGYGTYFHRMVIKKYGLSPIHRRSFRIKT